MQNREMHAAYGGFILWEKKSQLFEDLNAYWCLCFLLVNKVKMERIVFTKNRKSAFWKKGMFCDGELQRSVKISHRSENFSFCCRAMPIIIIITLLPIHYFAMYGFDGNFLRIKGSYCKLHRLAFTWLDVIIKCLASEKIVLASESNLSLATGLAS